MIASILPGERENALLKSEPRETEQVTKPYDH
jgi:hypothetical protein